jgi:hypothetical protein
MQEEGSEQKIQGHQQLAMQVEVIINQLQKQQPQKATVTVTGQQNLQPFLAVLQKCGQRVKRLGEIRLAREKKENEKKRE